MSHFVVYVLTDKVPATANEAESELMESFLPFQEEADEEYMEFVDIEDEYREKYKTQTRTMLRHRVTKIVEDPYAKRFENPMDIGTRIRMKAPQHIVPPEYEEIEMPMNQIYKTFDKFMKDYGGHEKPDGRDRYGYYANPNAKWDWFVVGGRWMGCLEENYDPRKDPENLETCTYCNGTGRRTDEVGRANKHLQEKCNGCEGTGKKLKWHLREIGWSAPVSRLAAYKGDKFKEMSMPFAFLTPDGEWIEEGEMGWWGCVSSQKKKSDWKADVKRVYKKYPNHYVIAVDCHI